MVYNLKRIMRIRGSTPFLAALTSQPALVPAATTQKAQAMSETSEHRFFVIPGLPVSEQTALAPDP